MTMQLLAQAVGFHQAGNLLQAARIYEQILRTDPRHPDALHLLGLVKSAAGEHEQAITLIEQAVAIAPENPVYLGNLGVCYRKADRTEQAIETYRRTLEIQPNNASTHFNLGKSLRALGQLAEAEASFQRAIELKPDYPSPWLSLMNMAADAHNLDRAVELGNQAVAACPNKVDPLLNLGVMFKRRQQIDEATACYQRAVATEPRNVQGLCKLAMLYAVSHRVGEATQLVQQAMSIDPESSYVFEARGGLCRAAGDKEGAKEAFEGAIARDPENAPVLTNLALTYKDLGHIDDALRCSEESLQLQATSCEALANHGILLTSIGRFDEGLASIDKSLELRPTFREAYAGRLMSMQYTPAITPGELLKHHQEWNSRFVANLATERPMARPGRDSSRPVRIGFLSPDLGNHPVGFFTVGLFEHLDRDRFETFVYNDRPAEDPVTTRIKKCVPEWKDVRTIADKELTELVRRDQLDIAFDLTGHTAGNRLPVFARRVAPVQITWAGYVGTTGLTEMDYLLADQYHVPPGTEGFYAEQILRMPGCYVSYDAPGDLPPPVELPALKQGYLTFGAFCNPSKVNEQVLRTWADVLRIFDDSKLIICYNGWPQRTNEARVLPLLESCGISPERISLESADGAEATMRRYNDVDVSLDTFPYSGGLTAAEAMHMGVPTITWPGETFAGRHTLSHQTNAGVPEVFVGVRSDGSPSAISPELISLLTDLSGLNALRTELADARRRGATQRHQTFAIEFMSLMDVLVGSL